MLNKAVRENRQRDIAEERRRISALKATERADEKVYYIIYRIIYYSYHYDMIHCSVQIVYTYYILHNHIPSSSEVIVYLCK
jgi:hypothetical protein